MKNIIFVSMHGKITTFKDFLEWYNNLDVLPFIEAVEKMKTFYKAKRLDSFKLYFVICSCIPVGIS